MYDTTQPGDLKDQQLRAGLQFLAARQLEILGQFDCTHQKRLEESWPQRAGSHWCFWRADSEQNNQIWLSVLQEKNLSYFLQWD